MHCSILPWLPLSLLLWGLVIQGAARAAESECMRYMPQTGKTVAVPCEEGKPSSQPPAATSPPAAPESAAPAPPPPAAAAPTPPVPENPHLTKIKKNLVDLTGALNRAAGDRPFRDRFCTLTATAQLIQQKSGSEKQKLLKDHEALEQNLGDLGRDVHAALTKGVMDMVLDTPADDGGNPIRYTNEGKTFVKARDGLNMSCNCNYESQPPHRLVCCDSCDQETLNAKSAATAR